MAQSLQIQTVLYRNAKENLIKALEALSNALVVDSKRTHEVEKAVLKYGDASPQPVFTEDEIAKLNKRFEPFLHIEYNFFNKNTGTAAGHNKLGFSCDAKYIIVMNPDIIVSPNFFEKIFEPYHRMGSSVGIVEARQTPIEHPKAYDLDTGKTSWASTAMILVPKSVFDAVNGFDAENFFMYCDDVDFSWRVRLTGKDVIYQPMAPVFHAKHLSDAAGWEATDAEIRYSAEAALTMAYKWSNNALCSKILDDFLRSDNDMYVDIAKSFQKRQEEGCLPVQLDKDHRVAVFVKNQYAEHRFIL